MWRSQNRDIELERIHAIGDAVIEELAGRAGVDGRELRDIRICEEMLALGKDPEKATRVRIGRALMGGFEISKSTLDERVARNLAERIPLDDVALEAVKMSAAEKYDQEHPGVHQEIQELRQRSEDYIPDPRWGGKPDA